MTAQTKKFTAQDREKRFKPYRVQLMRSERYVAHEPVFYVVIRDVVKNVTVASFLSPSYYTEHAKEFPKYAGVEGVWSDDVKYKRFIELIAETQGNERSIKVSEYGSWLSLESARAVAVATADERELPFNNKTDVLDDDEMRYGARQKCIGCGENAGHSFTPTLCEKCKQACAQRDAQLATREVYGIATDWFDPKLTGNLPANTDFAELLATLGGTTIADEHLSYSSMSGVILAYDAHGSTNTIRLSKKQARALQGIAKCLNESVQAAYTMGKRSGKSLLLSVAAGELTIDQINEKQFGNKNDKNDDDDE